MTFNKYMHPRNIYRKHPNFKQLAVKYPSFREYVTQDLSGKVKVNFQDPAALHALTTTLLKEDFDLTVDIPKGRMIPTLPLRLNYILWLEDLLLEAGISPTHGIDIGTGASCIYALLAAKTKQWSMLATDMDLENCDCAKKNVEANNLEHLIKVKHVPPDSVLKDVLDEGIQYSFCMCNPPFFAREVELNLNEKSRTPYRSPPSGHITGTKNELIVEGGEVAFVLRIINESKELKSRIQVYTTMLGHKSSVKPLKNALKEAGVVSMTQTAFYQGNTMRWGLAWSFSDTNKFKDVPLPHKLQASKPPLSYIIPTSCKLDEYSVECVARKTEELFTQLEIEFTVLETDDDSHALEIVAYKNTWTNQRKKRRQQLQKQSNDKTQEKQEGEKKAVDAETSHCSDIKVSEGTVCDNVTKVAEETLKSDTSSNMKRKIDDEDSGQIKKLKTDMEDVDYLLKADVVINQVNMYVQILVYFIDGTAGREASNQIMQYLKNNFRSEVSSKS